MRLGEQSNFYVFSYRNRRRTRALFSAMINLYEKAGEGASLNCDPEIGSRATKHVYLNNGSR